MIKNKLLPNLFIPGAAKSGTSTLHTLLNRHDDISMSTKKEPYYWIKKEFESFTEQAKLDYLGLFDAKPKAQYRGESSTAYMLFPKFIERLNKYNKQDIKFIFILRNPIDRIYSHYWYLRGLGSEKLDLKKAVLLDKDIAPDPYKRLPEGKYKHYYQYGLYFKWLSQFYKYFNANQIKIVLFEDLIRNPQETANSCFEFLEIDKVNIVNEAHENKTLLLKYPRLYRFLMRAKNGRIKFLKPLNKVIPTKPKKYLKEHLSDFAINTSKTNKSYPKLEEDDRIWLKSIYAEDVRNLKVLTGYSFKEWQDFQDM